MRSTFTTTLYLVAAVSLAACAVTSTRQNAPEARTVQSGSKDKIAYFYNLTETCQPDGCMRRASGFITPPGSTRTS